MRYGIPAGLNDVGRADYIARGYAAATERERERVDAEAYAWHGAPYVRPTPTEARSQAATRRRLAAELRAMLASGEAGRSEAGRAGILLQIEAHEEMAAFHDAEAGDRGRLMEVPWLTERTGTRTFG